MSTSRPTTAGIYVRISKARNGETLGVERQAPACRAFAEDQGWEIHPEVYVDNGVSAYRRDIQRESFERLLADVRARKINAIVTWQADRLLRTVPDATAIIEIAQKHGAIVANVGGSINLSTADGRKRFYESAVAAQYESEIKSERLQAKHEQLRANGEWRGGIRPFGYNLVPGAVLETTRPDGSKVKRLLDCRLEPNPGEAELVREAVSRILLGGSLSGIVRDWAARKPPVRGSRGGHLNTQRLRQILTGTNIAGLRQNGTGLVKAEWAPIVDRAEWERVRLLLADPPRKRGPQAPRSYLFGTDLLVCACGGRMVPHPRPGGRRGYQCSSQLGGCGKLRRTAVPLEDHVRDRALKALATPALRAKLVEQFDDVDATAKAQQLINQRETERARLADLRERLGDGTIEPDDFAPAKARITTRLGELDAQLAKTTDTSASLLATLPPTFEALEQAWEAWPLDIRRTVVKLVIERVQLTGRLAPGTRFHPDQVAIKWRI
jgi:site-specific DNA recombinase